MEHVSDAALKHLAEIGLTDDGVCRKTYVPYSLKAYEDTRRVEFVISTGAVDRDGDTVKVDGWDVANWLKAGAPILWGHDQKEFPVAAGAALVKRGGALHATAQFPPEGISPRADVCFGLMKTIGVPGAASVGFRPKKNKFSWNEERGGIDFEEQELLEFSICSVPANPDAVMRMAKDFASAAESGIDLEPIRKALAMVPAAEPQPDPVEKAGRRLSAKTEASLKSAHKAASDAVSHLQEALGDCEDEMEDAGKSDAAPETKTPAPPAEPVLMVIPQPTAKTYLINPTDMQSAVKAAVTGAVQSALNRARGRLD